MPVWAVGAAVVVDGGVTGRIVRSADGGDSTLVDGGESEPVHVYAVLTDRGELRYFTEDGLNPPCMGD